MSHEGTTYSDAPPIEAGRQVAHFRHMLDLAEEMAQLGRPGGSRYDALDEAARTSAAYERSLPVERRRFDALAGETATWTAAAVEALLQAQERTGGPRAAAAQLASELEGAIRELGRTLRS